MTPDERWANNNSASQRATQHQPEASDPIQMKSTPVYKDQSIHSSHLTQPPIPATNRNSAFPFGLERCEFPGLYKPALPDLRQDLNTTPIRVNNSGSDFSSPSLLQPCTSGRAASITTRVSGRWARGSSGYTTPGLSLVASPASSVGLVICRLEGSPEKGLVQGCSREGEEKPDPELFTPVRVAVKSCLGSGWAGL